jgi:hypothetical protein
MGKKTKALSGASQDAYFRRVLKAHLNLPAEDRDHLVSRLRQEIAQVRLRTHARTGVKAIQAAGPPVVPAARTFDPFSPNVIVVVRKSGRDAALAALGSVDSVDHLRLLAREQRLAVPADLSSAVELRSAIVAAAERRITNRIAAAS